MPLSKALQIGDRVRVLYDQETRKQYRDARRYHNCVGVLTEYMERFNKMWCVKFARKEDILWEPGEIELVGPGKLYEMEEVLAPFIETPYLQLEEAVESACVWGSHRLFIGARFR